MYTILVDKECGCFKKSEYENNIQFHSKDDALLEASQMQTYMNSKFCNKHDFVLKEDGDNFLIEVSMQQAPTKSGCCGGGHCS